MGPTQSIQHSNTIQPTQTMSCCPPNADKYLAATYDTTGEKVTLPSGLEVYRSGSASVNKKAVLIISDVWGWNSGRTRNIADMFAEAGYLAIVPKLMTPAFQGGTDGDGLYPTFDFVKDGPTAFPYFATFDYETNLRPKISAAVAYLKSQGATQIAGFGFCWGGWVLAHAMAGELGADFVCGAIPHPSVHLEGALFQRDANALMGRVQKPLLLMPALGDTPDYHADGAWFKTLQANHPTSESHNYLEVNHGFVPRGDHSKPEVREAVDDVLTRTFAFFAKHFNST